MQLVVPVMFSLVLWSVSGDCFLESHGSVLGNLPSRILIVPTLCPHVSVFNQLTQKSELLSVTLPAPDFEHQKMFTGQTFPAVQAGIVQHCPTSTTSPCTCSPWLQTWTMCSSFAGITNFTNLILKLLQIVCEIEASFYLPRLSEFRTLCGEVHPFVTVSCRVSSC